MTILSRDEIIREIKKKRIRISGFQKSSLGPASYDLTLDNTIRVFKRLERVVEINEKANFEPLTVKKKIDDFYELAPGELILGITKEKISLSPSIAAWLGGRSRYARLGLVVHMTAAFVQPGVSNRQVLEIYNGSPFRLALSSGEKIAQIIFERCEGTATYSGRFKNQKL